MNNRPLSPHVVIYRWPLNAILSILHRATGVGLVVGAILIVWWLFAAATSSTYFFIVDSLLTSFLGEIVLVFSLASLWFHACNGIRHLIWDTGKGFDSKNVNFSAWAAIIMTCILTVGSLVIIQ